MEKSSQKTIKNNPATNPKELKHKQFTEACRILDIPNNEMSEESVVKVLKSNTKHDVAAMHLLTVEKLWDKFGYNDLKAFIQTHYDCHYTTTLRKCHHYEITYSLRFEPVDYKSFTPHSLNLLRDLKIKARRHIISELTDNYDETKFCTVTSSSVKKKAIELGYIDAPVEKTKLDKMSSQLIAEFVNNGTPKKLATFLKETLKEKKLKKLIAAINSIIAEDSLPN
ncbi:hypothetical protein E0Z06_02125 [Rheinheimera sp. D18]|uniref:hypothetical protein n=1 Tax=Rheinheimera sp. D18 TaxID=2545632 RepID=UPI00104E7CB8|nr:hypothetical protein [Rheinheimera sp. D18]QBL08396.1 hypothetical protein E0Z06_02125 [Rheinheimera sp. D18]